MMAHEALALRAIEACELQIDDDGRIWRVAIRRWDRWKSRVTLRHCKPRRAEYRSNGRLMIRLIVDGHRYHIQAHRLVYLVKRGPIPQGVNVLHRNRNDSDNKPDNLELSEAA